MSCDGGIHQVKGLNVMLTGAQAMQVYESGKACQAKVTRESRHANIRDSHSFGWISTSRLHPGIACPFGVVVLKTSSFPSKKCTT